MLIRRRCRSDDVAGMDLEGDDAKPKHECGVFGVYSAQRNASRVTFFALYALNHRGQESAGIASYDKVGMHVHKGMGLVSQVFAENDIDMLKGTWPARRAALPVSSLARLPLLAVPSAMRCDATPARASRCDMATSS
jgi:hypothetical protein